MSKVQSIFVLQSKINAKNMSLMFDEYEDKLQKKFEDIEVKLHLGALEALFLVHLEFIYRKGRKGG